MPAYEFVGPDPIEHHHLGHVEPGDVVELDDAPHGPWKATKRRPAPPVTEPRSDTPDSPEEV